MYVPLVMDENGQFALHPSFQSNKPLGMYVCMSPVRLTCDDLPYFLINCTYI